MPQLRQNLTRESVDPVWRGQYQQTLAEAEPFYLVHFSRRDHLTPNVVGLERVIEMMPGGIQLMLLLVHIIKISTLIFSWWKNTPDHLLLDSAPNLGPLISRWEINKFENGWYKSDKILEVLKLLFQQILNLSSFQWDISGPILRALSNNRWSWGIIWSSFICLNSFLFFWGFQSACYQLGCSFEKRHISIYTRARFLVREIFSRLSAGGLFFQRESYVLRARASRLLSRRTNK